MSWLTVIVVGVVQGITEFLPISSSGHLLIVESLLAELSGVQLTDPLTLNVALHGGTLLSILVVYWQRIWRLLGADRQVVGLLIVGTLPAVVVGLGLKSWFETYLASTLLAGCMLPVTGALLWWSSRASVGETSYVDMTYRDAITIGMVQAFAILPGISRSGATIATALRLGLTPDAAATFSFLLALPAIAGACVLELAGSMGGEAEAIAWPQIIVGAVIAFLMGLVALVWLQYWLQRGRFYMFAYWCVPVGVATVIWQLWPTVS